MSSVPHPTPNVSPGTYAVRVRPPRRSRFVLLLVALIWPAQLMPAAGVAAGISTSAIAQEFQTTQIAWFALVYTVVSTLLIPVATRLGDRYGKKRMMIIIACIGLLGDVIIALAPTFPLLIVGRVLAAFYGPIAALVFSAARDVFPPRRLGLASSIIGSSIGITTLVVPMIMGILLDGFGFRAPFWALAVAVAVAIVLLFTLPETPLRTSSARFDVPGSVVLTLTTVALIVAVDQIATAPVLVWAGLLLAAAIGLVVFVAVERRQPDPLIDISVMRRRQVSSVLVSTSISLGAIYAATTLLTLLTIYPAIPGVSDGLGFSGVTNAWVSAPGQIVLFAMGFVVGRMSSRWDPRLPWTVGVAITALGMLMAVFLHTTIWHVLVFQLIIGLGSGLAVATSPLLIVGSATPREQGMLNGTQSLLSGSFQAIVTAAMFAVMTVNGTVADGTTFYSSASYGWGYAVITVTLVIGAIAALWIPRIAKANEVEAGEALHLSDAASPTPPQP